MCFGHGILSFEEKQISGGQICTYVTSYTIGLSQHLLSKGWGWGGVGYSRLRMWSPGERLRWRSRSGIGQMLQTEAGKLTRVWKEKTHRGDNRELRLKERTRNQEALK